MFKLLVKLKFKLFHILFFIALLTLTFFYACTTKKNTWATRTYHNTTNRFNLQFNAKEAFKEGVDKIEESKEDYTKLIPIFYYGTNENVKSIYPEMDKAIKKASTAIQRHSIFIKGREYCKWTDDNYLLIGMANFYKRDYFEAIEDFDYVAKQYKNQSTHFDAILWLARSYLELGNMEQAQLMFNIIDEDKKFPKKEKAGEISLIQADFFMKQKNYELCADHLSKALKFTKKRKYKIRYNYILAQLYAQIGNNQKASFHYDEVLKLKPSNDMLFYAKINRVKVYEINSANSSKIRKELLKMSHDVKYEEFKDQIYYALAELCEREHNRTEEIKYLKLCVASSTTNQSQKALAYLKLADLYYGEENYRSAQLHYDSAFVSLPKDFPGYSDINLRRRSLNRLVENLDIIQREDSLQGIAKMSEKERDEYIEKHIQKLLKERERKKQEEANAQAAAANNSTTPSAVNTAAPGSWYFYNPTTLALGVQDFRKKWGDRKLEDNWRRSNKETVLTSSFDSTGNLIVQSPESKEDAEIEKIKEKTQYLKDIPKGDSAIIQSTDKIILAYNNAGNIYREELENNSKAINMFEELLLRYPENRFKLPVYYQLYRLYIATNNNTLADKYKNIILKDYEFTEYGQLISNPEYNVQVEKSKYKAEQLYEQAYESYKEGSYNSVVTICNTALRLYKGNEYAPKFEYLRAVAYGRTESLEAMENALRNLVSKYPTDPIKPEAESVLRIIEQLHGKVASDSTSAQSDSTEIYKFYVDADLFYVMLFPDKWRKNEEIKNRVSMFNEKYFSNVSLAATGLMLNNSTQMIIVKQFPNKQKGLNYFTAIRENAEVFKDFDKTQVTQMLIAPDNFSKLYQTQKVQEYMIFFEKVLINNPE